MYSTNLRASYNRERNTHRCLSSSATLPYRLMEEQPRLYRQDQMWCIELPGQIQSYPYSIECGYQRAGLTKTLYHNDRPRLCLRNCNLSANQIHHQHHIGTTWLPLNVIHHPRSRQLFCGPDFLQRGYRPSLDSISTNPPLYYHQNRPRSEPRMILNYC